MALDPFIELSGIAKRYGGVHALRDIDLKIRKGEVHCLAGENGCGKSTLIKIISGVIRPEPGGSIRVGGETHGHLSPHESTRRGIQVIYQDLSLFPHLSVAENVAIGGHAGIPHAVSWRNMRKIARAALEKVGAQLDLNQVVGALNIAERQMVAICRALAADAKLLIMDEPTASLTHREVARLLAIVKDLQARGIATVFVSHRLDEVMEIADQITVIRDGSKVGTFDAAGMTPKHLATLMTGKEFDNQFCPVPSDQAPEVLKLVGLKREGEYADISMSVRAGEIVSIIGLLGSGRTEPALSLFGITSPQAGEVILEGRRIRPRDPRDAINLGIAYVPEDRLTLGLVLPQSIGRNLALSVLGKLPRRGGLLDRKSWRDFVSSLIKSLTIKVSDPELPVKTLSGGNQQRVVLAKWIATHPRLLILDSPTVGVDINAKAGIYETVRSAASQGIAVILITDEAHEALYNSHRILVMHNGRIVAERLPRQTSDRELEVLTDG